MSVTMNRLLALVYVVTRGQEKMGAVGHTLVQKLFYLLQAGKKVPLGYKFRLYHYGPYCHELWGDLNVLEEYGYLSIKTKSNGFGYEITATDTGRAAVEENRDVEADLQDQVQELLELLGGEPVRKLEALATTHYVCNDWGEKGVNASKEQVIASVLNLKPHLHRSEVEVALTTLEEKGLNR
ncbi:MAG: hypothetical protein GXX09_11940 [Syntrophomonadaceae bacterium]|nr:hypothetical protein [Syntrophomonadaceae bacterium]